MLERAHQWSQDMTDKLASILCLQESPEQSRTSLTMPAAINNNNTLLDTTIARRQAAAAQLQLAGLSASFYVQQGRKSLSVSIQKSPRSRHLYVYLFIDFSFKNSFLSIFIPLDIKIIKTIINLQLMKMILMMKINPWKIYHKW